MGVVFIQQNIDMKKFLWVIGGVLMLWGDSAIRTAVRSTGDPGECGSDDKGVRTGG